MFTLVPFPEPASLPNPDLSVVVPAYNEAHRIHGPLLRLAEYLRGRDFSCELVIVDDGSYDDTAGVVAASAPQLGLPTTTIRYASNHGKGYALRVGFAHARGRRILFTDADLSTPIEELESLIAALDAGAALAIGSRKMQGATITVRQPWHREMLGKAYTRLVNVLIAKVSDATCGFKLFDGDVGRALFAQSRISDWCFDAEILFLADRGGHRITEVPVHWHDEEGTKVHLLRDGIGSFLGLLRIRWLALRGAYARAPRALPSETLRVRLFAPGGTSVS